jgi:hypothetical protein
MPHSNFAPHLQFTGGGQQLNVIGPLVFDEDEDDGIVSLLVSAFVTQAPAHHADGHAGVTCRGSFADDGASITETANWTFPADAHGGAFHEGWAFGTAEMTYQADNGAVETYVWSQWVWLQGS